MKDTSHQCRRWHQLKQVWMMRRHSGVLVSKRGVVVVVVPEQWCTSGDSLKKEREGMEVLPFTDESRKRIRVKQSTAEVMFQTCTWESAINVSF